VVFRSEKEQIEDLTGFAEAFVSKETEFDYFSATKPNASEWRRGSKTDYGDFDDERLERSRV
jgi:hypothetical protein